MDPLRRERLEAAGLAILLVAVLVGFCAFTLWVFF